MARYTGPKNKISRREGVNLFGSTSRSLERRLNQPPGMQARGRRRRISDYAVRLREKQKMKRMYGLMERQFVRLFEEARRRPGNTGLNLLQLLEQRLDNTVYRLGLAKTRPQARQFVTHGHVTVNGRKVDIPSYQVRPGDVIGLDPTILKTPDVEELLESGAPYRPGWLSLDGNTGRVLRAPTRDEIDAHFREELVIEFYSR
jgi:small subunit ribosomal protein S4